MPHIIGTSCTSTELPPPPFSIVANHRCLLLSSPAVNRRQCRRGLLHGGGKACQYCWRPGLSSKEAFVWEGPPAGARWRSVDDRSLPPSRRAACIYPSCRPLLLPQHRPPLPLLTSPPAMTITAVCPGDVLVCPDGLVVSREIVDGGCNFAPCPDRAYPVGTAGGHFFPVWGGRGGSGSSRDDGGAARAIGKSVLPP